MLVKQDRLAQSNKIRTRHRVISQDAHTVLLGGCDCGDKLWKPFTINRHLLNIGQLHNKNQKRLIAFIPLGPLSACEHASALAWWEHRETPPMFGWLM